MMVVEMHTWSPDWKRVSIITIIGHVSHVVGAGWEHHNGQQLCGGSVMKW
jgi:hypothetical protein